MLLARYQQALETGELRADPAQADIVKRLASIGDELMRRKPWKPPQKSLFARWLTPSATRVDGVPGLYVWGGVGRGKTLIADLFFDSLGFEDKLRLHFHSFMQAIHRGIRELGEVEDPLERIADDWAPKARLLLLDEIHVNDITDAMLLGGLLNALFARGVTLVTTSNVPPEGLYRDGLQRARFLPAIAQLRKRCEVVQIADGEDYRLTVMKTEATWFVSQEVEAGRNALYRLFERLAGLGTTANDVLTVGGRPFPVLAHGAGVLLVTFDELCVTARATSDYIELANAYHTVLIDEVPVLDRYSDDAARRFVNLVDELYDRGVRVAASAAAEPDDLYRGQRLAFEFERAASRLYEMRSSDWLERAAEASARRTTAS